MLFPNFINWWKFNLIWILKAKLNSAQNLLKAPKWKPEQHKSLIWCFFPKFIIWWELNLAWILNAKLNSMKITSYKECPSWCTVPL
jgi:hypothetical protein